MPPAILSIIASPVANESVQLRAARQEAILMGDQMRRAWADFLAAERGMNLLRRSSRVVARRMRP